MYEEDFETKAIELIHTIKDMNSILDGFEENKTLSSSSIELMLEKYTGLVGFLDDGQIFIKTLKGMVEEDILTLKDLLKDNGRSTTDEFVNKLIEKDAVMISHPSSSTLSEAQLDTLKRNLDNALERTIELSNQIASSLSSISERIK